MTLVQISSSSTSVNRGELCSRSIQSGLLVESNGLQSCLTHHNITHRLAATSENEHVPVEENVQQGPQSDSAFASCSEHAAGSECVQVPGGQPPRLAVAESRSDDVSLGLCLMVQVRTVGALVGGLWLTSTRLRDYVPRLRQLS